MSNTRHVNFGATMRSSGPHTIEEWVFTALDAVGVSLDTRPTNSSLVRDVNHSASLRPILLSGGAGISGYHDDKG